MSKLKERWGITSNWEFAAIFIAFAINGSFASYIVKPCLALIGVTKQNLNPALYWTLYLIPVFIIYQFTLPYSGWIVGQYKFFKNMQNKMLARFKKKN